MREYKRVCPNCEKEVQYKGNHALKYATKHNCFCQTCKKQGFKQVSSEQRWYRKCPICNKDLAYKTYKWFLIAEETKRVCSKCVWTDDRKKRQSGYIKKHWGELTDDEYLQECENKKKSWTYTRKKEFSDFQKEKWNNNEKLKKEYSEKFIGVNNPFYGKHHSKESLDAGVEKRKNNVKLQEYFKSDFYSELCHNAMMGDKNPMYGKSCYDVWVNKYGKEVADKKLDALSKKHSENNSGEGNPMYGKPAPIGSGGGWSGWYKGWYFRSLRELTYMIKVIEVSNYSWVTAESNKLAIRYLDEFNVEKTYRADFLIENKWLVEIKPKALMETETNKLKKIAAEMFCKVNGYEYRMVDVKVMPFNELVELCDGGKIKLIDKWKNRLEKLKCK